MRVCDRQFRVLHSPHFLQSDSNLSPDSTTQNSVAALIQRPERRPIELWDNDGVVNTAPMLWPKGEKVLVLADHLDIVGHYKLVRPTG